MGHKQDLATHLKKLSINSLLPFVIVLRLTNAGLTKRGVLYGRHDGVFFHSSSALKMTGRELATVI